MEITLQERVVRQLGQGAGDQDVQADLLSDHPQILWFQRVECVAVVDTWTDT
jgi:hypothetical protein